MNVFLELAAYLPECMKLELEPTLPVIEKIILLLTTFLIWKARKFGYTANAKTLAVKVRVRRHGSVSWTRLDSTFTRYRFRPL